jgi:DNA helicase HerA-like ATPase
MNLTNFTTTLSQGYGFSPLLPLGQAKYENIVTDITIGIPLSMLNRHGLIAGATGTWKTKSVQLLVEWCAQAGVPTLVMDMKWDISGLSMPGDETHPKIAERYTLLKKEFHARGFDSEFMSLTGKNWFQRRTTIIELWPLILAQMLELNETQTSVLSAIFFFCDKQWLALLDLEDLQSVIKYLGQDEINQKFESEYGMLAPATLSVLLRKTIELEQQWGQAIFGEPSLDISDIIRTNTKWEGMITIFKLEDIQTRPNLFCAAMLGILSELYATLPEVGDMDKPKLVMIIDEAHLLFQQASSELLQNLETMIKLIRSKGVGLFFCTQLPDDVPASILSQLGTKIQHALRAFTERDRKAMKSAVENYPITEFYKTDELITSLWVGEILFTTLSPKGIPTPLAHVFNLTPSSRMDTITPSELDHFLSSSLLVGKYNTTIDRESASEILAKKLWSQEVSPDTSESPARKENVWSILGSKIVTNIWKEVGNIAVRSVLWYLGIKVRSNKTFF